MKHLSKLFLPISGAVRMVFSGVTSVSPEQGSPVLLQGLFRFGCRCLRVEVTEWDWNCGTASGCPSAETDSRFPAAWLFLDSPQPDVLHLHTQNSGCSSLNPVVNS